MLSIMVAIAENNVIGKDGKLIWHIPVDLKYFKETTQTGTKTMIMGRKTFESLPYVLPGRKHIVLTRNPDYRVDHPNVTIVHDYDDIRPFAEAEEEYYLIGGGQLFNTMMPYADRLYITWVEGSYEGDTFFPEIPADEFMLTEEWQETDPTSGAELTFATYDRVKKQFEEEEWEAALNRDPGEYPN